MRSRSALALALLAPLAGLARAADIFPQVYGVAQFSQPFGPPTDLVTFGTVLPGDGRTFDFGQFSHTGAPCTPYSGQSEYLCASASARVDINRVPLATSTYVGVATSVVLKAQVHLDYRNASATSGQIWAKASLTIPLACNASVLAPSSGVKVWYRLNGDYQVSVSDSRVIVKAPRPFEDCPNGLCSLYVAWSACPDVGGTTAVNIDLWPKVQIDNSVAGSTSYSVFAVSDYSHTFTLEAIDALDTNGGVLPNVRLVVPGDNGAFNDVFLTSAEAAEVAAATTTTTTTSSTLTPATTTTVTSPSATTSSTLAACATGDLAAADCRCARRPPPGCEAVTLRTPVTNRVNLLCTKVAMARTASGKKQRRFAKQAVASARKALRLVNGRKENDIPDACREALRTFLSGTAADVRAAIR